MTGMLVRGKWKQTFSEDSPGIIKNWITVDGESGPSGNGGFKAQKDRYHLFVSKVCPLNHLTLIFRKLKGLEDFISVSFVDELGDKGWEFARHNNNSTSDDLYHSDYLYEIYLKSDSTYTGYASAPVLWDKKMETIVSNECGDIIRMLNSAFNGLTGNTLDFYPKDLRQEIDDINEAAYKLVNDGVYNVGLVKTQVGYERAVKTLFKALDALELRLESRQYLVGKQVTEADWRLFTTLFRFDSIYNGLFKCNIKRIVDYPALWGFVRELYQMDGISETCDLEYTKKHYYKTMKSLNPNQVVPLGPQLDFLAPHNRSDLSHMRESKLQMPAIQQKGTEKANILPKQAQKVQQEVLDKKQSTSRIH